MCIANTCNRLHALVAGDLCPAFQALASKLLLLNMYVAIQNEQVSCRGKNPEWNKETTCSGHLDIADFSHLKVSYLCLYA